MKDPTMTPNEKKIDRLLADEKPCYRNGPKRYLYALTKQCDFRTPNKPRSAVNGWGLCYGGDTEKEVQKTLDTLLAAARQLGITLIRPCVRPSTQRQLDLGGQWLYYCYVVVPRYDPELDEEDVSVRENTKVTLTLKQLKKLVQEAANSNL